MLMYIVLIFFDALFKNKNFIIACFAIITSYIQLFGYGLGFIEETITKQAAKKIQEELYK